MKIKYTTDLEKYGFIRADEMIASAECPINVDENSFADPSLCYVYYEKSELDEYYVDGSGNPLYRIVLTPDPDNTCYYVNVGLIPHFTYHFNNWDCPELFDILIKLGEDGAFI